MEYPKIHSLYKRDSDTHKFLPEYAKTEFNLINYWNVQEKIDGMNIRIIFTTIEKLDEENNVILERNIFIRGRTDDAMIPQKLLQYFQEREKDIIEKAKDLPRSFVLYGEGFGSGIQKGGSYRKDQAFILFDSYMNMRWGSREEVSFLANLFGFEEPSYIFELQNIPEIISYLKTKPASRYNPQAPMEGIIARTNPVLRLNQLNGDPLMFKLKVKDLI